MIVNMECTNLDNKYGVNKSIDKFIDTSSEVLKTTRINVFDLDDEIKIRLPPAECKSMYEGWRDDPFKFNSESQFANFDYDCIVNAGEEGLSYLKWFEERNIKNTSEYKND